MMRPHHNSTRRWATVWSAAVIATLALSACSGGGSSEPADVPAELRIAQAVGPNQYNPYKQDPGYNVFTPAYDTLLHLDAEGNLIPWLATEWEFTQPNVLSLTLRDDVTFTDGEKFDAEALKANIDYGVAQTAAPQEQVPFKRIQSVTVTGDYTADLTFDRPNPEFPYYLSQSYSQMVSPAALAAGGDLGSAPEGSGPYVLDAENTRVGSTYTWVRNDDYWLDDAEETYPFDTLEYSIFADNSAASNAARSGQVDILLVDWGQTLPGFESVLSGAGPESGYTGLQIFDLKGTTVPALADERVRQAMNYAIDMNGVNEAIYAGTAVPVPGIPVSPAAAGWPSELDGAYEYDVDKAKELLAEAGYEDGFTIKATTPPPAQAYAQAIAGYLREVGINVELGVFQGAQIAQEVQSGNWQAGLINQPTNGTPIAAMTSLFGPNANFNIQKYESELVPMLNAALDAPDEAAQIEATQAAAVQASDESRVIGMVLRQSPVAYKADVVTPAFSVYGQWFPYMFQAPQ